jgi:hypothetical protein
MAPAFFFSPDASSRGLFYRWRGDECSRVSGRRVQRWCHYCRSRLDWDAGACQVAVLVAGGHKLESDCGRQKVPVSKRIPSFLAWLSIGDGGTESETGDEWTGIGQSGAGGTGWQARDLLG